METDEFGFALHVDSSDDVDDVEDVTEDPELAANLYGSTQLYQLIRSGNQRRIVQLIDAYGEDFGKVRKHLERKYRWDKDDKIWLKKTILVACSEEQCRVAKNLENAVMEVEDLRKAVFVLLQHPVNDEEVAILHPDETSRLAVAQLIIQLIPNGFLTWKCIASGGKNETFMEAAAACGLHEVIDKLYELGDPIAIPQHNPLLQACGFDRKDTIQWLLTRHFDNFDCTLRDASQRNALIVALQRNDPKMVELLLGKMIAYRCKHYGESETEAFNKLFRYESNESDASIFFFSLAE
uniref:(northern house mosquito) hypothetical protein n=1 Tax=Culex pipiens TaxID=7175 RepID=A0A8D8BUU9_CULPI